MKEIRAIINPHLLGKVVRALHEMEHFPGVTLLEARGQGRGRGAGGSFRITEDDIDYHPKVVVVVVCSDAHADSVVDAIRGAARTGHRGDGVITVANLEQVIRIQDGARDEQAV